MGRGPKDILTHLLDDLLVVCHGGILTAAEQHLVKALSPEKGRDLLKQVSRAPDRNRPASDGTDGARNYRRESAESAP